MRYIVDVQINQTKSTTLKLIGIIIIQIILSLFFYGYHSKFLKAGYSFWFSMWAPVLIVFLLHYFNLKNIKINNIFLIIMIALITIIIEAVALYMCIMAFGE